MNRQEAANQIPKFVFVAQQELYNWLTSTFLYDDPLGLDDNKLEEARILVVRGEALIERVTQPGDAYREASGRHGDEVRSVRHRR